MSTQAAAVALGLAAAGTGLAAYALARHSVFDGLSLLGAALAMASLPFAMAWMNAAQVAIATQHYEAGFWLPVVQAVGYALGVAVLAAAAGVEGALAGLARQPGRRRAQRRAVGAEDDAPRARAASGRSCPAASGGQVRRAAVAYALLIPPYGAVGAALASTAAYVAAGALSWVLLVRAGARSTFRRLMPGHDELDDYRRTLLNLWAMMRDRRSRAPSG